MQLRSVYDCSSRAIIRSMRIIINLCKKAHREREMK